MKKSAVLFISVIISLSVNAQVEFTTKISKDAVMIGEPFKIEYKVNKNFDEFKLTDNDDFEIISGPSTSFQQSINMTNGKMKKKTSVTYTYFVRAKTPGKQNIPVADIKIKGKYYYSNAKEIIVINAEFHDPKKNEIKDIEGTSKL